MALIECPECGKQISEQASTCPNCGFKVSKYRVKKYCKNHIEKLKEKKIHISRQSFKDMFCLSNIIDQIDDLPLVGRFLGKLLLGLLGLVLALLLLAVVIGVVIAVFYVIGLLAEVSMALSSIAMGLFFIVINYLVWYKDRRLKFWIITIIIVILITALTITIC